MNPESARMGVSSPTALPAELDAILRETSRSIYLTLRLVSSPVRRQLMLGYLFCRAADTIADTRALPREKRIDVLALYRAQFESPETSPRDLTRIAELVVGSSADPPARDAGFSPAEAELLRRLDACFAVYHALEDVDRRLLMRLLTTLTQGMQVDLETFPSEEQAHGDSALVALADDAELDRYCYHVAGCVGEFWTDLQAAHLPALARLDQERMRDLGVRFGKGLQLTNILRDMPDDLRMGRCYLPRSRLEQHGIHPLELRDAVLWEDRARATALAARLQPIFDDLLDLTLDHYAGGLEYTLALPRLAPQLRIACALPLLIGLGTLEQLRFELPALLAGRRLKISRGRVYRLLAAATGLSLSNRLLEWLYRRLEARCKRPGERA